MSNPQDPAAEVLRSVRRSHGNSDDRSLIAELRRRLCETSVIVEPLADAWNEDIEATNVGDRLCCPVSAAICNGRSHHGRQNYLAHVVLDGGSKLG